MNTKVIKLPLTFPLSEVLARLDIYAIRTREIDDSMVVELDVFDFAIFKDYLTKEGVSNVYTEL